MYIHIPHLLCAFICWWTSRMFPCLAIVNSAAINISYMCFFNYGFICLLYVWYFRIFFKNKQSKFEKRQTKCSDTKIIITEIKTKWSVLNFPKFLTKMEEIEWYKQKLMKTFLTKARWQSISPRTQNTKRPKSLTAIRHMCNQQLCCTQPRKELILLFLTARETEIYVSEREIFNIEKICLK